MSHVGFGAMRRFDEFYRCYPVVMLPGPERENVNHGGKVIMPPSALDKLTRLHITYPMMFELVNGAKEKTTHAGVLEFIAEEGKIYLPYWLMQTLLLEPGDLLQVKSTDLPPGSFIKLQAQSPTFLDISDPKAVLEQSFRNFSCLTKGDIFTFSYNDQVYEMAVLETKPVTDKNAVSVLETDLEVDFAAPVGYEEPSSSSKTSTTSTSTPVSHGGLMHSTGTMAQAINYAAISPETIDAAENQSKKMSFFSGSGHKLGTARKSKKSSGSSTPASVAVNNANEPLRGSPSLHLKGPQPLRLPPGKLFFGYKVKPLQKRDESGKIEQPEQPKFQGSGQTLRSTKKKGDKK
ncbi:ubiquitin fusion degradation protein Ufd1 [Ascosphaera apis ARSEF 7405]|uniref:Ubiquitin fusion degradation protein 1 n=1 Tax=Ascosphaera apis ARSEF 7405 TaxID=392613 RepID=A0A166PMB4_9EURO|nr:ubiquitin fusion degradation protein Ufd1 [Ascosphaera apis ARSEF 7405]